MKTKKPIKVRSFAPDFSTHTRKTPTLQDKKRKTEKKHKKDLKNYEE